MPSNDSAVIEVKDVRKRFRTYKVKGSGALGILFNRQHFYKKALRGVSFKVRGGEIVALLGKNGSGKSTIVKIMTGIIRPDSGDVRLFGMRPWEDRMNIASQIGVVLGATHTQLYWDLPPFDTFLLMKEIYGIEDKAFRARLRYFVRLLGIGDVYRRQTRTLSLGERMKCELLSQILHMPKIVFMDEPTIGVDLPSRLALKEAMNKIRTENGTTFMITTHVVEDVTDVDRIILMDKGRVLFDDTQERLRSIFAKSLHVIVYSRADLSGQCKRYGKITEAGQGFVKFTIAPSVLKRRRFQNFITGSDVSDFRISEPTMGELLRALYSKAERGR